MVAEPTLDSFLATLRRSRLLEEAVIARVLAYRSPTTARTLADTLVRTAELTHYQADKLLRGRWQGLVLGPYAILAPLGRGGMGTVVYLARDRRLTESLGDSVLVALKLLPERKSAHDARILARFQREMELGRRVNHANVVRTFAAGEIDRVHFLALEFIPGRTLRQVILQNGPLAVGEVARVFADVALGLSHIHERGLVHRDLKPGNVMLRPDGTAVVFDLGLAFAPRDPLPDDPTIVGGRGYVVGTMDYLAPEQARNASQVDARADLYSMGCAIVAALTGEVPFPAKLTKDKVRRHRDDPPPPLATVPPAFARVVHRLMAKDPGSRYSSAIAVREELLKWATAPQKPASVSAIALADAPGMDAGLWDATPGDELPLVEEIPEEEIAVLEEIPEEIPAEPTANRTRTAILALAVLCICVVVIVLLTRG